MRLMKASMEIMNLTRKDCALIMDNCYAGLFVTDGDGRIIYANHDALNILGVTAIEILQMDIYQLRDLNYTTYSSTEEVLKTGKRVIGSYINKNGEEIGVASTPVYDEDYKISMVVTYCNKQSTLKQFNEELSRIHSALEKYEATLDYLGSSNNVPIVAEDPAMKSILNVLNTMSGTNSSIIVYGESGVGKEVVATYIYQNSLRKDKVFIPINCAAIPENLIESELFGYEKGTFTGASRDGKAGIFELANGGTIFMDEIGELPLIAQSKLLRTLESGEYRRIGGEETRKTDVRIISATNRDLKQMVAEGKFRADLYYRLNVIPIFVPALRERPLDLDVFATRFLAHFNRKHGQHREITENMMRSIHAYSWPGNVRELRNVIEQYVLTGSENAFSFDGAFCKEVNSHNVSQDTCTLNEGETLKETVARFEEGYLRKTLERCQGNVSAAAKKLGISRATFYEKIKKRAF